MIELPSSSKDVVQKIKSEFEQEIPESNPFLSASWLGAMLTALGKRVYAFYITAYNLIDALFPDMSFGTYLDRWCAIYGITQTPATKSSGEVLFLGTASTAVPGGTALTSSGGNTYTVTTGGTILAVARTVQVINRVGFNAEVTFLAEHKIPSGADVTFAGAVETEYNGTFTVTSISPYKIQYTLASDTAFTPPTGSITATATTALVEVESVNLGQSQNLASDEKITLAAPIAGVISQGRVAQGGISGGTDAELDTARRDRLLEKIQTPAAPFSAAHIEQVCMAVPGVTRVWVGEATPTQPGVVTVYFVRDGDVSIFPSPGEVATVETEVMAIKPAITPTANVLVDAPTEYVVNFTIDSLTPDTPAMRTAIEESLEQYFLDSSHVGVNLARVGYNGAIFSSADADTGEMVTSFNTTTPAGDVTIASGNLGTLGTVTFT